MVGERPACSMNHSARRSLGPPPSEIHPALGSRRLRRPRSEISVARLGFAHAKRATAWLGRFEPGACSVGESFAEGPPQAPYTDRATHLLRAEQTR